MDNLIKKLESGAELNVTPASFPEGHRLFKAVAKVMQEENFVEGTVQALGLKVLSNEEIEAALWPCAARGTYNGLKINPALFEDLNARADFLSIMKEVLAYNLIPFSKSLGSIFRAMYGKEFDILK